MIMTRHNATKRAQSAPHGNPFCKFGSDVSAQILTNLLKSRRPFFYVRYGDGAIECMNGLGSRTCDHEWYSPALGRDLREAWESIMKLDLPVVGDWLSASFQQYNVATQYESEYRDLVKHSWFLGPLFVHFEALLLNRPSRDVVDFYRAVKQDSRRKVYFGPAECAGAAKMLGAHHVVAPMQKLHDEIGRMEDMLVAHEPDVILYGAGMAGTIPCARLAARWKHLTCINIGSAMDPLFRGQTRTQQLSQNAARQLFKELL